MAIQVSGTSVINNSRQLQNIASVDAGTVTALNNAGVGGGGVTALGSLNLPVNGTSITLSNLDLTDYKFCRIDFTECRLNNNTSMAIGSYQNQGARNVFTQATGAGISSYGGFMSCSVDLNTGIGYRGSSNMCNIDANSGETPSGAVSTNNTGGTNLFITNSSTSITIVPRTNYTFQRGIVYFWGIA
tara:strand:- start:663 stop:1223 length:561 start_codon:yes stop_codon:yes gene_type:complete